MINLRYHIFSLVAVFVALAIGIAAGSTVVRGPLLDSTRARLDSAEKIIDQERAENDALAAEVAQLDGLGESGPAQLLDGRLEGRTVLLLVAGDVDGDVVDGLVRSFDASDAAYLGDVRIDSSVFDPDSIDRVADATGAGPADPADPGATMAAFGTHIGELVGSVASTKDEDRTVSDVLSSAFGELEDAGLVDLLGVPSATFAPTNQLDLVIVTDRNLLNDPADVLSAVIDVRSLGAPITPMLVAEVGRVLQDNESPIPSFVGSVRGDGRLRDEVSTVDNAETVLGWIGVVLGVDALSRGEVGQYGFRDGADQQIPSRAA